MSGNKATMKCSNCGDEKKIIRLCGYWGRRRVICSDCCDKIQEVGKCRVKGCPFKK